MSSNDRSPDPDARLDSWKAIAAFLNRDIGLVDVATRAYRVLKRFRRPWPGNVVRRSPDGAFVAYDIRPTLAEGQRDIHLLSTTEMPLRLGYIWTFDWSRDARWLVFRATGEAGRNGIFLVDAQTGRTDLITTKRDDFQAWRMPQFTDDGTGITYFRRNVDAAGAGGSTAYIRSDIASRTEHVIETSALGLGPGRYSMGRSPDGRYRLAIHDDLRKAPSVLFAYDTVTGRESEAFRVAAPNAFNYEDGLQWMPDGRAVIVNVRAAAPNAFELWWIPVDGRQPRRLDIGVDNLINNAIAVHPDGRHVAFLAGDPVPSTASSPRREFRLLQRFLPETTKHDTP